MFNHKILNINEIRNKIDLKILSKPYQVYLGTEFNSKRFLVKAESFSCNKIFVLLFNSFIYYQLKEFVVKNTNKNAIYTSKITFEFKSDYCVEDYENEHVFCSFEQNVIQTIPPFVSCLEIEDFIHDNVVVAHNNDSFFDEKALYDHMVDESWLKEQDDRASICLKCSYNNPYVSFDPHYICHGCRIGY